MFFATISLSLLGQSIYPTSDNKPVWTLNQTFGGLSSDLEISLYSFSDTIFNGYKYSILSEKIVEEGITIQDVVVGFYRVLEDKVYVRTNLTGPSSREFLQYDFGLSRGDSTWIMAPDNFPMDSALCFITERDTIACMGENLIRLKVSLVTPSIFEPETRRFESYWIASFGDTYHPFRGLDCFQLNCEYDYQTTALATEEYSFSADDFRDCLAVSINDNIRARYEEVSVYPNVLSRNDFPVRLNLKGTANSRLTKTIITSMNGAVVFSKENQPLDLYDNFVLIDSAPVSKGLYFLTLSFEDGGNRTFRLIVN